jgi:ribose transport system ATP-binding protein
MRKVENLQPDLMLLPSPPLVEMREIQKSFGGVPVLKSVRFSVRPAEVMGLVGENGAGKSTLVKILSGEVAREGGEILWSGAPVPLASRADAARLGIALIHQELNLAQHLSVAENIFLGHEPASSGGWPLLIDHQREADEARDSLEKLGFDLDPRAQVRRLSTAQRQLVEIARAVIRAQRLVIMDEPTSSLSAREIDDLFRVIRQLKAGGTAVVFVTHRLEELAQIADRVTVLRDGEAIQEGPMPHGHLGGLIQAMVGRELKDLFPSRRTPAREAVLEVQNLCRRPHFQDVSFVLRRGEIVGLAGLVGAGRTEVAETLFGINPPHGGRILIDGKKVAMRAPQDALRCGLALLTEDRKRTGLAHDLSVTHNLTLANLREIVRCGVMNLGKEEQVVQDFLDRLRVRASSVRQKICRLSGGNQQKVVLGKWLFSRARIFLLDEPTRGVDVAAKTEIYRSVRDLAESGAAILMVSSDLPEILGMTDRVLVMRNGRLVKELITTETNQEEIMRWAALKSDFDC